MFNDSGYDSAPVSSKLLEYGRLLLSRIPAANLPLRCLKASGYYRAEAGPAILIFDGGQLGPDHQMGHAQGDMLSFCLWLRANPVIVQPGNYEYLPGPMRDYCRSTGSHNTLVLNDAEQADWWASHRVGWRGHPHGVVVCRDSEGGTIRISGSHDGFYGLSGAPVHTRQMEMKDTTIEIQDRVTNGLGRKCRIYFHFHPACKLESENGIIRIGTSGGTLFTYFTDDAHGIS